MLFRSPAFLTCMNLPFFPCTSFLLPVEHVGLSFAACWSGLRAGQAGLQCPWGGSLGEADFDTTRFACPNTVTGFPNGSDRKESACKRGDPGSIPVWGRSPGEGNSKPTAVFLPGKSHGRRSLVGYSPWGRFWCEPGLSAFTLSLPQYSMERIQILYRVYIFSLIL